MLSLDKAPRTSIAVMAMAVVVLGACTLGSEGSTGDPPACSVLFAEGAETIDLDSQPRCLDARGRAQSVSSSRWPCGDDELFANAYGYGVSGDPWRTDGDFEEFGPRTPLGEAIAACEALTAPNGD